MLEEILRIDTELFLYLNNLGTSSFDSFWSFLSRKEANKWFIIGSLLLGVSGSWLGGCLFWVVFLLTK